MKAFKILCLSVFLLSSGSILSAFDHMELAKILVPPPARRPFYPVQIGVDPAGRAWVIDASNQCLVLFSAEGAWTASFGKPGAGEGEFSNPHGLAIDAQGNVFVADTGNQRIQVFSPEGKFLYSFGEEGAQPGQFHDPWSVAVSADGVVVVSERGGQRLEFFSHDGIYLKMIEVGSEIDGMTVDVAGRIYTANPRLRQIEQWSSEGQLIKSFSGREPVVKGFDDPRNAVVDAYGNVFVADRGANVFREMDSATGRTLGSFGGFGRKPGQFNGIEGLAVRNEHLFVCDGKNHRVQHFLFSWKEVLAPLTPVSISRIQISRLMKLHESADALAFTSDGRLLALSSTRGMVTDFGTDGTIGAELDLKQKLHVRNPSAMAADSANDLWIADTGNDRAIKINPKGELLAELGGKPGLSRGGPGGLSKPRGLALTGQGNILVADTGNGRFQAFSDQGLYLFMGGGKGAGQGQFKNPCSIVWNADRIFVADATLHKIGVFDSAGKFLHEIGLSGPEPLGIPRQVAMDRDGDVFVLDAGKSRILVYDAEGTFVCGFAGAGKGAGFLDHPQALALSDDGRLFVADADRIQGFRVALLPPSPLNLQAKTGEGFVDLKWDAVKTRFPVKYVVYRGTQLGAPEKISDTVDTAMTDEAQLENTTYTYTVRAQSDQGAMSVPSAPVSVSMNAARGGPRLKIASAQLDNVFPAHFKYYQRYPLGKMLIKHNGGAPVHKVKVSFAVQGYMDNPSETVIGDIRSREEKEIPLFAVFNNHILEAAETSARQANVKLTFYQGGQEINAARDVPFKLYSRNSMDWAEKDSIASFVTPKDLPLSDFTREAAVPFLKEHKGAPVPESIAAACGVFEALGAYGVGYAPRPDSPYDQVSPDTSTADSIQFARETLGRKSGDHADLVVLLASSLESLGLATAVLDAPGHLLLMMDTGETRRESLSFPDNWLIPYAGTYWIPLEAASTGSSFIDAWKRGAEEYHEWAASGKVNVTDIHQAWTVFEPAALPEMVSGYKALGADVVEQKFRKDWDALADMRWQTAQENYKRSKTPQDAAQAALDYGMLAAQFKHYDEAKNSFQQALKDPSTLAAGYNNLGNLEFTEGNIDAAVKYYQEAAGADPADGQIWLNIARADLKKNLTDQAATAYNKAITVEPALKEKYGDVSALVP
jgi:DNA-binding beta-propeller fold protein YncE/tetratricopeptide (TPR) repeat protein